MTERLKHTFQLFVYFKYCLCYVTIFKRTRCNLVTFVNLTGTNIFLYFIGKSIMTGYDKRARAFDCPYPVLCL